MPIATQWYQEFEFDLPAALLRDLVALFARMEPSRAPLNATNVDCVPDEQGVYHLYLDDELVYVGKTDSEAGLHKRLARHANKIKNRQGLDPSRVTFSAVRIFVFTAVDLEQQLIKYYQETRGPLTWNQSGFGSNDPGRERDTTKLKADHFDRTFPIDIQIPMEYATGGGTKSVAQMLAELKDLLPYTLRFQSMGGRSRQPHTDLAVAHVTLPPGAKTVRDMLALAKGALGAAWQITVLPGYVIVYQEVATYDHGTVIEEFPTPPLV